MLTLQSLRINLDFVLQQNDTIQFIQLAPCVCNLTTDGSSLLSGPRVTTLGELFVLCTCCYSTNQYNLIQAQSWKKTADSQSLHTMARDMGFVH